MRYAGIIKNDVAAAPGVCLTFFTQGCPHQCPGCHNPETWDYDGGKEFNPDLINEIIEGLTANGVKRNFCIMGGEPLCPNNRFLVLLLMNSVLEKLPDTKIYIWTGYTYEELERENDTRLRQILEKTHTIIDGRFIQELRDISLPMRGSSNQRIIALH